MTKQAIKPRKRPTCRVCKQFEKDAKKYENVMSPLMGAFIIRWQDHLNKDHN